jgi:hypothetical protein
MVWRPSISRKPASTLFLLVLPDCWRSPLETSPAAICRAASRRDLRLWEHRPPTRHPQGTGYPASMATLCTARPPRHGALSGSADRGGDGIAVHRSQLGGRDHEFSKATPSPRQRNQAEP